MKRRSAAGRARAPRPRAPTAPAVCADRAGTSFEPVADAVHGRDLRRPRKLAELAPQARDVHVERVVVDDRAVRPGGLRSARARRTTSPGRARERGRAAGTRSASARRDCPPARPRAPRDRAASRPDSGASAPARRSSACRRATSSSKCERLRQVVVAARAEAGEPVGQRRRARSGTGRALSTPAGAQRLADVAPVGVGQADVDDEQRPRRRRPRAGQTRSSARASPAARSPPRRARGAAARAAPSRPPPPAVAASSCQSQYRARAERLLNGCRARGRWRRRFVMQQHPPSPHVDEPNHLTGGAARRLRRNGDAARGGSSGSSTVAGRLRLAPTHCPPRRSRRRLATSPTTRTSSPSATRSSGSR